MAEEQKMQGFSVSEHLKQISIPLVTYSLAAGLADSVASCGNQILCHLLTFPNRKPPFGPLMSRQGIFFKLDHLLVCGLEEEMPGFQLKCQLLLAQSGVAF